MTSDRLVVMEELGGISEEKDMNIIYKNLIFLLFCLYTFLVSLRDFCNEMGAGFR